MTKPIKSRIEKLEEQNTVHQDGDHDYKQVLTWEADDRIVNRYYKDGIEITAVQYHREAPDGPAKINIDWTEYDPEGDNGQTN